MSNSEGVQHWTYKTQDEDKQANSKKTQHTKLKI
jgi:hypothetical protein